MKRIPAFFLVAIVAYGIGCSEGEPSRSAESRPAPTDLGLVLELTTTTPRIKAGETPSFSVWLTNEGTADVTIVLPGDGSDRGWRTPIIRWNPRGRGDMSCGNINPLKAHQVLTLEPRYRIDLGWAWLGGPNLLGPGTHPVSVEYEHVPDLVWRGIPLGEHDPDAMARIRRSAPIKVVSNVVEIHVDE